MDNTEKLLRALIDTLGYEIETVEGDLYLPNLGINVVASDADYILTKKKPLTITTRAQEIGGTHNFGQSVI